MINIRKLGHVNAINTILDLLDITYISSVMRNLVSISILDRCGYTFHFHDKFFFSFYNLKLVNYGTFYDDLCMIDLFSHVVESSSDADVLDVVSSKHKRVDDLSGGIND